MANIGKQIEVRDGWHVALVNRDSGSAALFPVACWCIVDGVIVPFFYDARPHRGRYGLNLTFPDSVDEDFIAIVPPGGEFDITPWNNAAKEMIAADDPLRRYQQSQPGLANEDEEESP